VRNGILALLLGLTLGVGAAFLIEFLDDSIKTKDQLERLSGGLPVLALLPTVDDWKSGSEPRLVALSDPSSPAAEAYRSLRTSLQFLGIDRAPRVFQVASANTGEGKTTTTANLAVVLARSGQRVVMVDCDLRRSRLHQFAGLSEEVGFTSVFVGNVALADAVQQVAGVENLFLLAAGPRPPNQSELLGSQRTAEIFAQLQDSFDVVVVDCPPVLPVTDASALSAWVDATIVVARAGLTPRTDFRRALELLRQVGAPLVGTVLNEVEAADGYGYRYGRYESDRSGSTPPSHSENGASASNGVASANGNGSSRGSQRRPDVELQ
jgi:capsular exopolysaccharide synthesis family protein